LTYCKWSFCFPINFVVIVCIVRLIIFTHVIHVAYSKEYNLMHFSFHNYLCFEYFHDFHFSPVCELLWISSSKCIMIRQGAQSSWNGGWNV
jgi:hypothetical protein